MAMELFRTMAGITLTHVAFKGSAASVIAVIGGEIPLLTAGLGQAMPHAESGRLRILAVTSEKRSAFAPNIPSVSESPGLAGYEAVAWQGLLGLAHLPAPVVWLLNGTIDRMLRQPSVIDQLAARAWIPASRTPAAFSALIASDVLKWAHVMRTASVGTE